MTKKDSEHYFGLLDTAVAHFERINANSERSLTLNKILSNGIACYKKSFAKGSSVGQ